MPKESVFCLALSRDLANQIVDRVKTSGFSSHDVSALFPDQDTVRDLAEEKSTRTHRREQLPASQGTAWWTARRSCFASIGALAIPGVGHFVAAGSIIFALSGAVVGGAGGGGLAGALIGMGISEFEASRYESKIKEGNILILVHAGNPADITLAKTIFREAGAHCICSTDEASHEAGAAIERVPEPSETASCPFEAAYGGTLP
jgi:hypothetical protein